MAKTKAPKASEPKKRLFRWKLVRGIHVEGEGKDEKVYGKDQKDRDIIVTEKNLARLMNTPGSVRVIRLDDIEEEIPLVDAEDELDAGDEGDVEDADDDEGADALPAEVKPTKESLSQLSKAALFAFAAEKEIPLGKAKTKENIIDTILFGLE